MTKENQKIYSALLVLVDALICLGSMVLGYFLHFSRYTGSYTITLPYYLRLMVIVVPVYFLLYHYFNMHDFFRYKSIIVESGKCLKANLTGVIFIFVLLFFLKEVHVSRMVILLFAVFNTAFTTAERILLRNFLRYLRRKGYHLKRLLIVGWNEVSFEFYQKITSNKNLGYQVVGYLCDSPKAKKVKSLLYGGALENLPDTLARKDIDEVVISLDDREIHRLGWAIEACEKEGVKSSLLPFYTKYLPTKPYIDEVEGLPLINIRKIPLDNFLNAFVKRAFDVSCSLLMLVLLSPFLLAVAIGVKLSSPGPIVYKQDRIGRNKKIFTMYKFRSMGVQTDGADLTTWGGRMDERRTKFGEFIRKFSIDELPQLFNVLKGDMSLVGPRPERPFFVEKFKEEIPLYMVKHLVRPGITGWAQVNGWRGDTSIEERIKCDIFYIENWTFLLDIKILFMTVLKGIVNKSEDFSKAS